jgi:hypothetical protein
MKQYEFPAGSSFIVVSAMAILQPRSCFMNKLETIQAVKESGNMQVIAETGSSLQEWIIVFRDIVETVQKSFSLPSLLQGEWTFSAATG